MNFTEALATVQHQIKLYNSLGHLAEALARAAEVEAYLADNNEKKGLLEAEINDLSFKIQQLETMCGGKELQIAELEDAHNERLREIRREREQAEQGLDAYIADIKKSREEVVARAEQNASERMGEIEREVREMEDYLRELKAQVARIEEQKAALREQLG